MHHRLQLAMGSHDIARSSHRDIKRPIDLLANFVTPLGALYVPLQCIMCMHSSISQPNLLQTYSTHTYR